MYLGNEVYGVVAEPGIATVLKTVVYSLHCSERSNRSCSAGIYDTLKRNKMALQPQDFDNRTEQNKVAFLAKMEKEIDKSLEHAFSQGHNTSEIAVNIYYNEYAKLNEEMLDRLRKMYSGWNVRKVFYRGYDDTTYHLIFKDIRK